MYRGGKKGSLRVDVGDGNSSTTSRPSSAMPRSERRLLEAERVRTLMRKTRELRPKSALLHNNRQASMISKYKKEMDEEYSALYKKIGQLPEHGKRNGILKKIRVSTTSPFHHSRDDFEKESMFTVDPLTYYAPKYTIRYGEKYDEKYLYPPIEDPSKDEKKKEQAAARSRRSRPVKMFRSRSAFYERRKAIRSRPKNLHRRSSVSLTVKEPGMEAPGPSSEGDEKAHLDPKRFKGTNARQQFYRTAKQQTMEINDAVFQGRKWIKKKLAAVVDEKMKEEMKEYLRETLPATFNWVYMSTENQIDYLMETLTDEKEAERHFKERLRKSKERLQKTKERLRKTLPAPFNSVDMPAEDQIDYLMATSTEDFTKDTHNMYVKIDGRGEHGNLKAECEQPLRDLKWQEACPQANYITELMGQNINPEATFIKKQKSHAIGKLNMTHFSLGDERTSAVTTLASKLEFVKHIQLRNNRMTTESLGSTFASLKEAKHVNSIESLDLSMNKFTRLSSSQALGSLLKQGMASLVRLSIEHAGLRDAHAKAILSAMEGSCKALRVLNMSSNFLSHHSAIALAKLLRKQRFVVLDVSDNMISGAGGIVLCNALAKNRTLQKLNVEGNGLGRPVALKTVNRSLVGWDEGKVAERIFDEQGLEHQASPADFLALSLVDNDSLMVLDISRNQIGPSTVFCFTQALVVNKALDVFKVNGNSLLEAGTRALIRAVEHGVAVQHIQTENCKIMGDDGGADVFDPLHPVHNFPSTSNPVLNMKVPYHYFIACALVRMAEDYPGFQFTKLQHLEPGAPVTSQGTEIQLTRRPVDSNKQNLKAYKKMFRHISAKRNPGQSSFKNIHKSWITYDDTKAIIRKAHEMRHEDVCDRYLNAFLDEADADNDGQITWDEFRAGVCAGRNMFGIGAQKRGEPLPGVMCASGRRVAWTVPRKGTLKLSAKCLPSVIPSWRCCTEYSFRQILKLAKSTNNLELTSQIIHLSTRDIFYRTEQAALLLDLLMEAHGKGGAEKYGDVFLSVVDKENNPAMLEHVLPVPLQQAVVKDLGPLFPLAMGIYNGKYALNLADSHRDRRAALTLLQRQAHENGLILNFTYPSKGQSLIDTSQLMNGYLCMRNVTWAGVVMVRDKPGAGAGKETVSEEIDIDVAKYYSSVPLETNGIMRFDFVEAIGPDPKLSSMSRMQFYRFCRDTVLPIIKPISGYRFVQTHDTRRLWDSRAMDGSPDIAPAVTHAATEKPVRLVSPTEHLAATAIQSMFRCRLANNERARRLLQRKAGTCMVAILEHQVILLQKNIRRYLAKKFVRDLQEARRLGILGSLPPPFLREDHIYMLWYCCPTLRRGADDRADSFFEEEDDQASASVDSEAKVHFQKNTQHASLTEKLSPHQMASYFYFCRRVDLHPGDDPQPLNDWVGRCRDMPQRVALKNETELIVVQEALFYLSSKLANKVLTAQQCRTIAALLPHGWMSGTSLRVSLLTQLFSRCIDPENFETSVFPLLFERERDSCMSRIGVLNLWNPLYAERLYILRLPMGDEHKVASLLLELQTEEAGHATLMDDHVYETSTKFMFGTPKTLKQSGTFGCRYGTCNAGSFRRVCGELQGHEKRREIIRDTCTYSGRVKLRQSNYHKGLKAVILLQATTRGILTRKIFRKALQLIQNMDDSVADKAQRQATNLIQAVVRGFLVRKMLKRGGSVRELRAYLRVLTSSAEQYKILARQSFVVSTGMSPKAAKRRLVKGLLQDYLGVKFG